MSWYDEATKAIVALINAAIEERGDMPEPKEITAIIAKHDPNRWVPVTEAAPKGNAFDDVELYDPLCQRPQRMTTGMYTKSLRAGVNWAQRITHWRPIVLPEVKG